MIWQIFAWLLLPYPVALAASLPEKIIELQQLHSASSNLKGLEAFELPLSESTKIIFQNNPVRLEIKKADKSLPVDFNSQVFNINQLAVRHDGQEFALLSPQIQPHLAIVSLSGAMVKCPGFPSTNPLEVRILPAQQSYVAAAPEKNSLKIYRFQVQEGKCEKEILGQLPTEKPHRFRFLFHENSLHFFLTRKRTDLETSFYLEWVKLEGAQKRQIRFPDLNPDFPMDHAYTGPSMASQGVLISLQDSELDSRRKGLYLLRADGTKSLVDAAGLAGWWLPNQEILVHRGTHAKSSELVVVAESGFQEKRKIFSLPGFQSSVIFIRDSLSFKNYFPGRPVQRVIFSNLAKAEARKLSLSPPLVVARPPEVQEVEYKTKKGLIPGLLFYPEKVDCSAKKSPAIVYAHGGGFESVPRGMFSSEMETLSFAQAGFVVLQANYYGDQFLGSAYPSSAQRTLEEELARPQIEGLVAAGNFLKKDPCVDPERIFYFGHSNGSILGGILFTDKELKGKTPFRGAVLMSGYYSEPSLKRFYSIGEPPAAAESSRILQGRCFEGTVPKDIGQLSPEDGRVCSSFLDALTPIRRLSSAHTGTAIFLINSTNDGATATEMFEQGLRTVHPNVRAWYPENAGHVYSGAVQVELIERVSKFFGELK